MLCRDIVFDVGITLNKYYTNVLCLMGHTLFASTAITKVGDASLIPLICFNVCTYCLNTMKLMFRVIMENIIT